MAAFRLAALVAVAVVLTAIPPGRLTADTSLENTLTEFAITAAPSGAKAGSVKFQIYNGGLIPHNFLVVDTDLAADALPLTSDGLFVDESQVNIVGRTAQLMPGGSQSITLDLPAGNYVLICNNAASHYTAGMRLGFQVSGQVASPSAPAGVGQPASGGGPPAPSVGQPTQAPPLASGTSDGATSDSGRESVGPTAGAGPRETSNGYWWVLPTLAAAGAGLVLLSTALRRRAR